MSHDYGHRSYIIPVLQHFTHINNILYHNYPHFKGESDKLGTFLGNSVTCLHYWVYMKIFNSPYIFFVGFGLTEFAQNQIIKLLLLDMTFGVANTYMIYFQSLGTQPIQYINNIFTTNINQYDTSSIYNTTNNNQYDIKPRYFPPK